MEAVFVFALAKLAAAATLAALAAASWFLFPCAAPPQPPSSPRHPHFVSWEQP
jgi:hypothetical protein